MNYFNENDSISNESEIDETEPPQDTSDTLIDIKQFNHNLSVQIKYLNDDINDLGYYCIFDTIDGRLFLNVNKLASSCFGFIKSHKDKLKLLEQIEDKNRFITSELIRMEKLHSKKINENDLLTNENCRSKEIVRDLEKKISLLNNRLKVEQTNIRNLKSSVDREKSQIQNSKFKLEKEMQSLKDRMNKLLSDPKRQYPTIEINNIGESRSKSESSQRCLYSMKTPETEINEEMCNNYRRQIEDLILENRQLKEELVSQLLQLKQFCLGNVSSPIRKSVGKQRNNSGSSNSSSDDSSDSDLSIRSNETFILPKAKPSLDERMYLEMKFDLVKDDIVESFNEYFKQVSNIIKGAQPIQSTFSPSNTQICVCNNNPQITSIENIGRLQKEIFQLRKRLTDYEDIIQGKDSLLETAIQQRIRRGSLLPD